MVRRQTGFKVWSDNIGRVVDLADLPWSELQDAIKLEHAPNALRLMKSLPAHEILVAERDGRRSS